jgi:hypothetical protein
MTDLLSKQPALKSVKTLNGKFDARCHVCWNAVYVLWIDEQDPAGKCPLGHIAAHRCPDAMNRARDAATIIKLKQQGLIR